MRTCLATLRQLGACRALLDALVHVDATFDAAFADIYAPPGLAAAVSLRFWTSSDGPPSWQRPLS